MDNNKEEATMARTKSSLATVRNPVKKTRATELKGKLDDLDNYLDSRKVGVYNAAGAISPSDNVVYLDATAAGMAMTLANGVIAGETITVILRSKADALHTAVVTPATAPAGNDTWTFDTVGERVEAIWVAANGWTVRAGATAALA